MCSPIYDLSETERVDKELLIDLLTTSTLPITSMKPGPERPRNRIYGWWFPYVGYRDPVPYREPQVVGTAMAFPNAVAVGQLRPYSIDRYGTICSVHLDQPHQGKRSRPPWHQAIRKKKYGGEYGKRTCPKPTGPSYGWRSMMHIWSETTGSGLAMLQNTKSEASVKHVSKQKQWTTYWQNAPQRANPRYGP